MSIIGLVLSLSIFSNDPYTNLSNSQMSNLKLAEQVNNKDGHPPFLIPAIIFQESKAGKYLESPAPHFGMGQMSIATSKEVLTAFPEARKICGVDTRSSGEAIKTALERNPECSISMVSWYCTILQTRYKISSLPQLIAAYQMGPNSAKKKKVSSTPYSKSVERHRLKIQQILSGPK